MVSKQAIRLTGCLAGWFVHSGGIGESRRAQVARMSKHWGVAGELIEDATSALLTNREELLFLVVLAFP